MSIGTKERGGASFTESRALDGAVTVILHDLRSPGADLAAFRGQAGPRLAAALAVAKANTPITIAAPEGTTTGKLVIWPVTDLAKDEASRRALGGRIAAFLKADPASAVKVVVDTASPEADTWTCQLAYGAQLRSYAFAGYRTSPDKRPQYPSSFQFAVRSASAAQALHAVYAERAASVHLVRDLLNEPPNILTPRAFVERIQPFADLGLEIEVLERPALQAMGMGALLAVARGSAQPPFVVVMRWNGGEAGAAPLALVGKGVTYDSGGLSLKPTPFMHKMKGDMGGAGAVVGAMRALAARQAPVNAVGVIGLVENMPSGDAYKPSDVLTTLSGQTVEVVDTDNEGRLVLCDLLTYTERTFAPRAIVDIATLTGGARMALGAVYAPIFSNDDALCAALTAVGEIEGERLWRLPAGPEYDAMFTSTVADMTNGRHDIQAHAIMGARFLHRFIDKTPWAHIDIGATWTIETDLDNTPAGFTGFGTALLERFAAGF